eukprot:TRINITY_DN5015_c0_g1_i1.p1 TRINITY_DN5015_c0_g1~~TRINITY_DN5015_c0_g1_i1.p1  ORF type:complete len:433 (-),score=67.71 TRINITY_DN5015_c0_g1_i1:110-1408(-)
MSNVEPEDDPEMQLSIPLGSFYEEFGCPVCFSSIKECLITPCGHNFCSACILECINRKHQCPCCNKPVVRDQLIRNHHFDKMLSIVETKKAEASKSYFEGLINGRGQGISSIKPTMVESPSDSESGKNAAISNLSPIQEIFHKHMKKSLLAYEEYYKDLHKKFLVSQESIKMDYASRMVETKIKYDASLKSAKDNPSSSSSSPSHLLALQSQTLDELSNECDRTLAQLQKSWQETEKLLLEAYELYMKDAAPSPSFLPVSVTLVVPSRDITIPNVIVKPTDNVQDMRAFLIQRLQALGNPIVRFSPNNVFVLRSKLGGGKAENNIMLTDEHKPILQSHPSPGSELVVLGELALTSDLPKECFTLTYDKSGTQTMDYYSCKDCKINWICSPCAENCHKGHQVNIYIKGHKPTWACCYDPKLNKCKILNSKSKT